ncbi:hypothetical protein HDU77_008277 [Chytriomyces hyalinus]|nr:hypothetical protein HDU77_008277 [Chytriomyces hyalinus]
MQQQFRYLAVLDFEATCDDSVKLSPQEIIEFPTLVIDTAQPLFPVVKEFHSYVKPTFHPTLTPFCTSLTGIQQETVDKAPVFKVVWDQFLQFLDENNLTESNTLFVTCGHWDLLKMLPAQLKALHITQTPKVLQQWCNIKIASQARNFTGLPDLLNHFGLDMVGRHHSGIDDSRNIAAVARKFLEQGHLFLPTPAENRKSVKSKISSTPQSNGAEKQSQNTNKPRPPKQQQPPQAPSKKNQPRAPPPPPPDIGPLVDIGANLAHTPFTRDSLPQILSKARSAANVRHILITGTSVKGSREAISLCRDFNVLWEKEPEMYPRLWCTVGVHPHDSGRALEEAGRLAVASETDLNIPIQECATRVIKILEVLIQDNRDVVVAVGECGLDFDRNFSTREDQLTLFEAQARLSRKLKMPLFLHERSAHAEFMDVFKSVNQDASNSDAALFGVLHCYTGETEEHLQKCLDVGLSIGITGWVTDEREGRGGGLAAIAHKIPLDRLLIETDAPFLLPRNIKPAPKVCEPALVGHVAVKLAELYGVEAAVVAAASTRNAQELFGLQ